MLRFITWATFTRIVLVLTAGYYTVICLLYYRREILDFFRRRSLPLLFTVIVLLYQFTAHAQADGNNGLNQANTMVRSYYETATQLMDAIAAIAGLIGAIRVYVKHTRHQELGGEIAAWFGACIFLVLAATVLKSFFGL